MLQRGKAAAAVAGAATSSAHASRLRQLLADQSRQTAMEAAADGLEKELNECRRELADREEKLAARDVEHAAALRTAAGRLAKEQQQVTELQRRLAARDADYESLVTTLAEQTESAQKRLVTVKLEKLDADADAMGAAQQRDKTSAAKRKAEAELQEEAKRHCGTAERAAELTAANRRLEEEKESLSLICAVCCDARPSVLYLPCKHLAVCDQCDGQLEERGQSCPMCQAGVKQRHKKIHF